MKIVNILTEIDHSVKNINRFNSLTVESLFG